MYNRFHAPIDRRRTLKSINTPLTYSRKDCITSIAFVNVWMVVLVLLLFLDDPLNSIEYTPWRRMLGIIIPRWEEEFGLQEEDDDVSILLLLLSLLFDCQSPPCCIFSISVDVHDWSLSVTGADAEYNAVCGDTNGGRLFWQTMFESSSKQLNALFRLFMIYVLFFWRSR